ncbi:Lrp/AsnC family transcriptional regulator [Paenibacillus physcomitrellae]|uniref:HTH-type transcriptional regulator LrpB n=1 Tax=Paenibacillus physcomitrellae TaxID=1619311 RepID=A0ABQ1FRQ0_9BACL|nr:Lrp/AsnC family transcriptional regulator [Paenibacillus physcomitrellae]GGA28244.1 HTH-type transcriptional regulator LrpB [Paenibacillus physcomitrellae]
MANLSLDEVDLQILQCLLENALSSNKEIGERVHLTGQAVGARVRKLRDMGVIEGYTLRWNPDKLGQRVLAFITVYMNTNTAHEAFRRFAEASHEIVEMHRISGEGCYWLRARAAGIVELNRLLEELLKFGNYKLALSLEKVKLSEF